MDFETTNPAIPRYKGMRPFGVIPFQWSLHVQDGPGGKVRHQEFLAGDGGDPREAFVRSLLEALGRTGTIVVYSHYEDGRLKDLAGWLPEYAGGIERVRRRQWDLCNLMREQVYHPEFQGSFSLKAVLPALVSGLSYDAMAISEGSEAGRAYETMIREPEAEKRERIREDLLGYCKLDTLAMVKLVARLERECG